MTDYIKRIQSSLQHKVSVSRKEIKHYMEQQNMDINNPTSDQIEAVKYYFLEVAQSIVAVEEKTAITPVTTVSEAIEDKVLAENPVSFETAGENALTVNAEVRGMVGFKAQTMGIQLAESQIDGIASQIDASGHSFSETLAAIENALIAYIDYQHSQEASQVDSMLERVTERVAVKNHAIHQQLNDGIHAFTDNLHTVEREQKKITGTLLLRLKVPV
ncbi:hypothetical protein [Nostoc sp. 'Peltigera membranacea cyanobiont' 232]|uniref:hypothetical protein n=1 Tax=Nostoc sp. 'Peltigera membranacea cyanobiont' 232 TaxID=2014531 RepID=UPI000B957BC8|nr:hypothetical protein [Nostoc sp. 'Peltigera membranacea cyanobiont' 232]OYE02725.1 hypothetical protein CDG79_22340 [Nostoc sp. 'Peltigera membranacea cyanobiont' 232]